MKHVFLFCPQYKMKHSSGERRVEDPGQGTSSQTRRPINAPITKYFKSGTAPKLYNPTSPHQLRTNLDIMAFLAECNLSFSLVDDPGFIRYLFFHGMLPC